MRYAILVILAGLGIAAWLYLAPQQLHKGTPAPALELETIHGRAFSLSDLEGKCCVIVFFSIDDPDMRTFFKSFQFITYQFKDKSNIRYIVIPAEDDITRIKMYMSQFHFPGDILVDPDGTAAKEYRVSDRPAFFVLNSNLDISWSESGWQRDRVREIIPALKNAVEE